MSSIFVSYKREDIALAERLVGGLKQEGFVVWWDRKLLGGQEYRRVIASQIQNANVVIVIWTIQSIGSDFVFDEARMAFNLGKLLSLRFDGRVQPPLGFRSKHVIDMGGWSGHIHEPQFLDLVATLREFYRV